MSYREKLGYELNQMRRDIEIATGLNIREISYKTQTSINAILLIEAGNMMTVETLAQYMIRLQEVREEASIDQLHDLYRIKSKRLEGDDTIAKTTKKRSAKRCNKNDR